jgi:DNA-binding HxlR family transcriptional regulator
MGSPDEKIGLMTSGNGGIGGRKYRTEVDSRCGDRSDLLGDRWSLLILCKMTLQGIRSFNELLASVEGIATNIFSSRLRKLLAQNVIDVGRDASDRRRRNYCLTPKGKDLAPVLSEMMRWTTRHSAAARRRKMYRTVEEGRNGSNKK